MKPNKAEIDALREVLLTPLDEFVTEKERAEKGDERAEALAQTRMFTRALEAAELARGSRTTYMVILRHGRGTSTHYTGFGPYATQAQGNTATERLLASMESTAFAVVPTRNEHYLAQLFAEIDDDASIKGDWSTIADDKRAFKKGWRGHRRDREAYLA